MTWAQWWRRLTRQDPPADPDPTAVIEPASSLPPWARDHSRRLTPTEAQERARPRPAPPWELEAQREANRKAQAEEAQAIGRRYARRKRGE